MDGAGTKMVDEGDCGEWCGLCLVCIDLDGWL